MPTLAVASRTKSRSKERIHNGVKTTPVLEQTQFTPEQIFVDYAPRIYSLALRMLANPTDAEDVMQDVLVHVVRKLGSFRGDSALTTWLHRVTVNAALCHRRKRSYRMERQAIDPLNLFQYGKHLGPVRPWSLGPERQALTREVRELIEQAIAGLPQTYRDVFVLSDVEGLANAEVGELLGLSVPAVKSRLHRGRLLMRNSLAPYFEINDD